MSGEARGSETGGPHPKAGSKTHRSAISRRLLAAASALALLLAACEDLNVPGGGVATSDLLILPLGSSAPPPPGASFYLSNARVTTHNLIHSDGFNTLFARVESPSGSLASLDGASLGLGDSVLATLSPDPGSYGIQVAPQGLRFAALGKPLLTFSYARYGDLSVATGSRYADPAAYAGALEVWRETSPDRWSSLGGSGTAGNDVKASLSQAGHYLVAAPR